MTYYERNAASNTDGTPLFAGDYDKENEDEVRRLIEQAWKCELRPFGRLCPIDWFALRDGRMVGVVELKSRTHPADKFKTVFLNVRKWVALLLAEHGLGVPALFVVKFLDGVRYVRASEVDAKNIRIGGAMRLVKSHTDIEPVIEVHVESMRMVDAP